jgi:hypothetical protein
LSPWFKKYSISFLSARVKCAPPVFHFYFILSKILKNFLEKLSDSDVHLPKEASRENDGEERETKCETGFRGYPKLGF